MKNRPMTGATVTLTCNLCGRTICEIALSTDHLAAELFLARKAHAIAAHGWREEECSQP